MASENGKFDVELREFLFGKRPYVFRVIFTLDGLAVRVMRIWQSNRRMLSSDELRDAISDLE